MKIIKQENIITQQSKDAKYTKHRNVPYRAEIPKLRAADISIYLFFFFKFMCVTLSNGY